MGCVGLWLLVTCTFFQEDGYYIDGTKILLRNGTLIKTAEEVKEDPYYFSWREEGLYISIDKQQVKSVDYFSIFIPGKKPEVRVAATVLRRLDGSSVAFGKKGRESFRARHVLPNGRSAEGTNTYNRLAKLTITGDQEQGYVPIVGEFSKVTAGTDAEFRFYSLKGQLLFQHRLAVDDVTRSRKEKRNGTMAYAFRLPGDIRPHQVGLVEVISYSGKK